LQDCKDLALLLGSLVALESLFKLFEYSVDDDRQPLTPLIKLFFPLF